MSAHSATNSNNQDFSWSGYFGAFAQGAANFLFEQVTQVKINQVYNCLDGIAKGDLAIFDKSEQVHVVKDTYVNRFTYWASGYSRDTEAGMRGLSKDFANKLEGISKVKFKTEIAKREMESGFPPLNERLATRFSN
jgi:hypothetical protein